MYNEQWAKAEKHIHKIMTFSIEFVDESCRELNEKKKNQTHFYHSLIFIYCDENVTNTTLFIYIWMMKTALQSAWYMLACNDLYDAKCVTQEVTALSFFFSLSRCFERTGDTKEGGRVREKWLESDKYREKKLLAFQNRSI